MEKLRNQSSRRDCPDLSLQQRQEVFRLRKAKYSMQKIGENVGCSKSTVSKTLNHKSLKEHHSNLPWYEKGRIVHEAVKKNRGRPRERNWGLKNEQTRSFVIAKLKDKYSPKSISLEKNIQD